MHPREDRFTVKAFDCRPDGRIKPNALMQYLQEAAARHAEQLGFGFADLDQKNGFWVLVNLRMELDDWPRWNQDVTIRTWPSGCTRASASREFVGRNSDDRELFRAASEWMILDKRSGRPKNLAKLDLHLPETGPKALDEVLRRLQPAEGYALAYSLRVPFSALDFNGHVNNTEYVRWALDGLHVTLGVLPEIRTLQATYLAEVFEGDEIEVLVAGQDESHIRILERRVRDSGDTDAFLMEIACGTTPLPQWKGHQADR